MHRPCFLRFTVRYKMNTYHQKSFGLSARCIWPRSRTLFYASLPAILLFSASLDAADLTWTGNAGDKVFSNSQNWSNDTAPAGNVLYIAPTGNEAEGMILDNPLAIEKMYMGSGAESADSSLTLNSGGALSSGVTYIGLDSKAVLTINAGASLTASNEIFVGYRDGAEGSIHLNGGSVTSSSALIIGGENKQSTSNKGTGTVNISSGKLSVNSCQVGNHGSGILNISDEGVFESNSNIRISNWGGTSEVNISGNGKMYCHTGGVYVGERQAQKGTMTMTDNAYLETAVLSIGSTESGSGTMTLKNNAAVKITGNSSGSISYIGAKAGVSVLNIHDNASLTAVHEKDSDGNITRQTKHIYIGTNGSGVINQYGGTVTLETVNSIHMADQSTGSAEINISGGTFTATSGGNGFILGTRGNAVINLSGDGVFTAGSNIVFAAGYHANSNSTINQTGGTLNANAGITYGLAAAVSANANRGSGLYNLSGGTLNTTSIRYGAQTPASALFQISGDGVANISEQLAIPTSVSGGTLNAKSIVIPANGTLAISGGTVNPGEGGITAAGTYTFELSGGTLAARGASWSTELNAVLAENAAVTFAPEAGESITWNGIITGNGSLLQTGAGTLKLNTANGFDVKDLTISAGRLELVGTVEPTSRSKTRYSHQAISLARRRSAGR